MPLEELLRIVGAAPFSLVILALLWKADDALGEGLKKDISSYIQSISVTSPAMNWSIAVSNVYDRFFGSRFFSFRFFATSILVSVLAFIAIAIPVSIAKYYGTPPPEQTMEFYEALGYLIATALLLNALADYISNIETRLMVRLWDEGRISGLLALVLDFFLTTFIFLIAFSFIGFLTDLYELLAFDKSFSLWNLYYRTHWPILELVRFRSSEGFLIITAFLTTYITSIWIWIIVFCSNLPIYDSRTTIGRLLSYALPISDRPLRSIGVIGAVLTLLLTAIASRF
jgi:hypothetical protein